MRGFANSKGALSATGHSVGAQKFSSHTGHKVAVRKWVADRLGGEPRILDLLAGDGGMWADAWGRTMNYVGVDVREVVAHGRTIVCADAATWIADAALDEFDIIDIDTFGFPWAYFMGACERMAGRTRPVGFALTDGTGLAKALGGMRTDVRVMLGLAAHKGAKFGSSNYATATRCDIRRMLVTKGASVVGMEAEMVECHAVNGGNKMCYAGIVMRR